MPAIEESQVPDAGSFDKLRTGSEAPNQFGVVRPRPPSAMVHTLALRSSSASLTRW